MNAVGARFISIIVNRRSGISRVGGKFAVS